MAKKLTTSSNELKWQAENDANIMMRYQEITQDKARMSRAIKEATRQANDLQKRATAMKSVADRGRSTGGRSASAKSSSSKRK